ncbi:MAG: hypothetical protein KJN84_06425 [Bacteroidia bacterium]|nr:hypothetical protein [Bacteroidia bacterium]
MLNYLPFKLAKRLFFNIGLLSIFILGNSSLQSQSTIVSTEEHMKTLKGFMQESNNNLIGLIHLYKNINSEDNSSEDQKLLTLIKEECEIYVSVDPLMLEIKSIDYNAKYIIIDEWQEYRKVESGQDIFWVNASCLKIVTNNNIDNVFNSLFNNDKKQKQLAMNIHDYHLKTNDDYKDYLKEHKSSLYNDSGELLSAYKEVVTQIDEKLFFVEQIYDQIMQRYLRTIDHSQPLQNLTLSGHFLFGQSDYSREYMSEQKDESSGGNTDFRIDANYLIDETSDASVYLGHISQTLINSYSHLNFGGGYHKNISDHDINVNADFLNYKNDSNSDINYARSQFAARINNQSSKDFHYAGHISRTSQNYSNENTNSFSELRFGGNTAFKLKRGKLLVGRFDMVKNDSDLDWLNYTALLPRIELRSRYGSVAFNLDKRNYSLNEDLNNSRYSFIFDRRQDGLSKRIYINYRSFNVKDNLNYVDAEYSKMNRKFDGVQSITSTSFRARYFTNAIEQSFADLRFKVVKGNKVSISLDQNLRVNYPDSLSQVNQIDGVLSVLFNIKGIRFGPVVHYNLLIDSKAEEIVSSLNNRYKLGGHISGRIRLFKNLSLSFSLINDIGLIHDKYADALAEEGFVLQSRNPVNSQLRADAIYKLNNFFDLVFSFNKFSHTTNFDSAYTSTAVISNQRSAIQIGVRANAF